MTPKNPVESVQAGARIALLLDSLAGGGAERAMLNLAGAFVAMGHSVDLLVGDPEGALSNAVPANVRRLVLEPSSRSRGLRTALRRGHVPGMWRSLLRLGKLPSSFCYLDALAKYLRTNAPDVLLALLPKANINAVLASSVAGYRGRVILGAQNNLSAKMTRGTWFRRNVYWGLLPLMQACYRRADAVISVSEGVGREVVGMLGVAPDHVHTIYNPIVNGSIQALSAQLTGHPWLDTGGVPVVLGIGRLVAQKDFGSLVRAFARLHEQRNARLVILGGDESDEKQMRHKQELIELAQQLGCAKDVDFVGFRNNPYAFLARASVFVLSSSFEGFGNVLVEALACGCPVVSTDCLSGPAEILDGGRYGRLIPVGDSEGLAEAIAATLDEPRSSERLRQRADEFTVDTSARKYCELLLDGQGRCNATRAQP